MGRASKRCAARKKRGGLNVALYAVSTVQEEIGLRGAITSAYGVNPHVGIAVDVTHATDCPTIDKTQEGDIKLGGGPVIYRGPNMNPVVVERLRAAAEAAEITVQWGASGRGTGTDANAIQLARGGVAAGLISIPNRYMHSAVEMISLDDIDQCGRPAGGVRARHRSGRRLHAAMSFRPGARHGLNASVNHPPGPRAPAYTPWPLRGRISYTEGMPYWLHKCILLVVVLLMLRPALAWGQTVSNANVKSGESADAPATKDRPRATTARERAAARRAARESA